VGLQHFLLGGCHVGNSASEERPKGVDLHGSAHVNGLKLLDSDLLVDDLGEYFNESHRRELGWCQLPEVGAHGDEDGSGCEVALDEEGNICFLHASEWVAVLDDVVFEGRDEHVELDAQHGDEHVYCD